MGKGNSDSTRLVYVNEREQRKQNEIKTEKAKPKKLPRGNFEVEKGYYGHGCVDSVGVIFPFDGFSYNLIDLVLI